MRQTTIDRLEASSAKHRVVLVGGPVSDDELHRAEADLGVAFDAEYAIGLAADGRVRLSDHDNGEIVDIAESFEAFLIKLLDGRLFG